MLILFQLTQFWYTFLLLERCVSNTLCACYICYFCSHKIFPTLYIIFLQRSLVVRSECSSTLNPPCTVTSGGRWRKYWGVGWLSLLEESDQNDWNDDLYVCREIPWQSHFIKKWGQKAVFSNMDGGANFIARSFNLFFEI